MKVCEGKLSSKCPFNHNSGKSQAESIVTTLLGEAKLCPECPFGKNVFVAGGHRKRKKDTIQYHESEGEVALAHQSTDLAHGGWTLEDNDGHWSAERDGRTIQAITRAELIAKIDRAGTRRH